MMQFFRKNVRWIMLVVVVVFIVSCFAGYGLYSGGPRGAGGGDYPVARIDGERVMLSQIEREMEQMIRGMGLSQSITSEDFPSLRTSVLEQLAIMKELDKEAKSRKLSVEKSEIDETIKNIESSFPTKEVFLQQMQLAGMDERGFRKAVEEQTLRQKVFDEVTSEVSTDEQEMREFYNTMKTYAFQKPEGFNMNLAHFRTEEAAEKARADIESGKSWDSVLEAASSDVFNSYPESSPVLIALTQLTDDFEFLKNTPMNKVSKAVKLGEDDYLITIKRSKEAAGVATYNEVSADIEQMILGQKRQGLQSDFLQELRGKAAIEILDESLFSKPADALVEVSGDVSEETSGDAAEPSE
ncbi:MAG: SurA N-terminal domain-containing protein [Synergistaceae bacterium]|jgi:hypothetical protein|nr:SurA N-terminal domain-containing protein [Synergistaceae bacterium]